MVSHVVVLHSNIYDNDHHLTLSVYLYRYQSEGAIY